MAWAACGNSIPAAMVTTLQRADLAAPVRGGGAAVRGLDLPPREPGELAAQPGLVSLHRELPGEVDAAQGVEQRRERGDLIGLALDLDLAQNDAGVLVDHREQMPARRGDPVRVGAPRAAHGLAVHREHPASPSRCHPRAQALHERADRGVEPVGVDVADQPADGRLRRAASVHTEYSGNLGGQVSDPFGGCDERPRPGGDRAHRRGEHRHERMPHPATLPRIDDLRQRCA